MRPTATPESSNTSTDTSECLRLLPRPRTPNNATANQPGPKRAGVIRLGVTAVKTGNVAEGMNAAELAAAVRNTLLQNLKSGNVEVVPIDATGGAAIQAEAQQKECDYVVYTNVSHKKGGGGGFGSMFGSTAAKIGSSVGYPTSTAAVVATNTIAAATVAEKIKSKRRVDHGHQVRAARAAPRQASHSSTKAKQNQPARTSSLPWSNKPRQLSRPLSPSNNFSHSIKRG